MTWARTWTLGSVAGTDDASCRVSLRRAMRRQHLRVRIERASAQVEKSMEHLTRSLSKGVGLERATLAAPLGLFLAIGRWGSHGREETFRHARSWLSAVRLPRNPVLGSDIFPYLLMLMGSAICTVVFLMWYLVRG